MACSKKDGDEKGAQGPQRFEQHALSEVACVVGVVSGKGGVGKSFVSCGLAVELARRGLKVGILDADITGPSIPRMLGLGGQHATALGNLFLPAVGPLGIKVMSANMLLAHENDPVLWRGPVLAGAIRQFWSQTSWGPIDVLVVDMPPGTGDVALTVYQSLPVDGTVIVTTPQDLVSMIVGKAVKMAAKMGVGVLGLVENMSYATCPHCGERFDVFGPSHLERDAGLAGVEALDRLPQDPTMAAACDAGDIARMLPEGLLDRTVERVLALGDRPAEVPDIAAMDARYEEAYGAVPQPAAEETVDMTPEEI